MKTAGFKLRTVSTLFASLTLFASKAAWSLATNNANNTNRVKMKKGREYKNSRSVAATRGHLACILSAKKTLKTFSKQHALPVRSVRSQQPRGFEREQSSCSHNLPCSQICSQKSTKSGFLSARAAA